MQREVAAAALHSQLKINSKQTRMARLGDEARPVFLAAAELFLLALLLLAETNRLQLKILEIFIVI